MAAPTFVAEYETSWTSVASGTNKTSSSFNVSTSDVLVVVGISEDNGANINTPTNTQGAETWTLQQDVTVASYCRVKVWSAVMSGAKTGMTVSANQSSGSAKAFGFNVLHWTASDGVGASSKTNATGAPSLSLTTTQADSAICVGVGDWNAADGTSRTWRTVNGAAATERTYFRDSSLYTVYIGTDLNAGTTGAKTVGLSAPSGQQYGIVAVEIKGTAGGTAHTQNPTDTAGTADTLAVTQGKVHTDAAGTTDTTALSQAKVLTDAAGLTDSTTLELSQTVTATDSAGLTDTTQLALGIGVTANDTGGLTDSIAVGRDQVTTDGAGLTDSITTSRDIATTATDAAGLTDSVTIDNGKAVTQSDTAGATDTTTFDRGQVSTDPTGLTDSASLALSRPISDTAGLTDAVTVENGKLVGATDAAGLTDSVVLERFTAITDDPGLSDLAAMTRGTVITETTGLTDTVVTSLVPAGGITTPAERTFTVPAENRVLVVPAESRVFTVPPENRTMEA